MRCFDVTFKWCGLEKVVEDIWADSEVDAVVKVRKKLVKTPFGRYEFVRIDEKI